MNHGSLILGFSPPLVSSGSPLFRSTSRGNDHDGIIIYSRAESFLRCIKGTDAEGRAGSLVHVS